MEEGAIQSRKPLALVGKLGLSQAMLAGML